MRPLILLQVLILSSAARYDNHTYTYPRSIITQQNHTPPVPTLPLPIATTSSPTPTPTPTPRPTPLPSPPAARFTDPLLPTEATVFFVTATAYYIRNGSTVFTTYTDLVSGGRNIPYTPAAVVNATATNGSVSAASITPSSISSPVVKFAPCSTASGGGVGRCGASVMGALSVGYTVAAATTTTATTGIMTGAEVGPTTTVTEPFLGYVVAKGKATWVAGQLTSGGRRSMLVWRGNLIGMVGLIVGLLVF